MNALIESLNVWGARFLEFAPAILWQSSLLMALVLVFDFAMRRKIRPAMRYALWFVVFLKLVVPPTLALPTGAAWWLRGHEVALPRTRTITVNYGEPSANPVDALPATAPLPAPKPALSRDAWIFACSVIVSVLLFAWAIFRWSQIARCVRKTTVPPEDFLEILEDARGQAQARKGVVLRLTFEAMSPAVCGLFRPVILLPQSLVERLTEKQLRAVLLHELIHLRRGDVWVNCAQTLLQIVYWWHPLLWFANARVRRLREESVDDAVMVALNDEAEIYAPTLLEVAKLAFNRPLAALGLVGILESRNALRHRIERLLNFTTPRRTGLSALSLIGITAFTALAVPMGEPPARSSQTGEISEASHLIRFHAKVNPEIFTRNLKARAAETMHGTHDDLNEILVSILDGFGVECTPPRNITFDAATGEITTQNSSEALGIVDEVVRELNLSGGERILNPPYGLKQVLIEAQFYQLRSEDAGRLELVSQNAHRSGESSPWWEMPESKLIENRERLKNLGIKPISSPRIQTAHGIAATLSIGDATNNIQLECVPYVRNGNVNLTVLARTTGTYAPDGKGWPDLGDNTNCAIYARMNIPNGNGVLLQAEHPGTKVNLIVLLSVKILEPQSTPAHNAAVNSTTLHTRTFKVDTNRFFLGLDRSRVFTNRIDRTKPSGEIQSVLVEAFRKTGVDLSAPKSLFFNDSKGSLTISATDADLNLLEALIFKWNLPPPPEVTVKVRFVEADADNIGVTALLAGILTNAPGTSNNSSTVCGVLTEPQLKSVLKTLEKRDHADLLNEGEVTTLSGHRANFEVGDVTPFVTGFASTTNNSTPEPITAFTTNGTTLDVVPYVSADGYTIQMTLTPAQTEFLGYADPEKLSRIVKVFDYSHPSFPAFRIRTATISADVWDGKTLVLGNMSDGDVVINELNGKEIRRPFIDANKKWLYVFVTPTLIDPSGNRIHTKDYYDGPAF